MGWAPSHEGDGSGAREVVLPRGPMILVLYRMSAVVVVSCWLVVLTRHNTAEAGRFIVYVHYCAARQI